MEEPINWVEFSLEFSFGFLFLVLFIHIGVSSINTTDSWCSLSILLFNTIKAFLFHYAHVEVVFGSLKL